MRALRRRFPDASISYIVEPHAAPVVAHNPHIDEVIVAPRAAGGRGLVADLALGRQLRRRRFDLAIDFHGGPRASVLTWLSGARERVGYDIAGRAWMYTRRVPRARTLQPRHSVENQWDLLSALDIPGPDPSRDAVQMPVDADAAASVATRLSQAGIRDADRIVVMHVSAGNPFRRWPMEHFVSAAVSIVTDDRCRIVVTSGPSDRGAAEQVIAGARAALPAARAARILSCGEFSLAELRALLDRSAVYIGGDSGPLHIAATTRTAIVGLYGPTLPARSAPWRDRTLPTVSVDAGDLPCRPCDQRVCTPGDYRCLTSIRPERVADAALRCFEA